MSLLTGQMEICVMLDKTTAPDGYGGHVSRYVDGAPFTAAITFDASMGARVAERQGVTSVYTVTTGKDMTREYHDVVRRISDGKIFRVTSDGDDRHTPASASLNMRQVAAEEWELPNNE